MGRFLGREIRALALAAMGTLALVASAHAGGVLLGQAGDAHFALSCQNGHTYPIRARALAGNGDIVTAYLLNIRGRGIHVRLIPMGYGYRYAGPGIWFDGERGDALLYLTKYHPVPCHVVAS